MVVLQDTNILVIQPRTLVLPVPLTFTVLIQRDIEDAKEVCCCKMHRVRGSRFAVELRNRQRGAVENFLAVVYELINIIGLRSM